MQIVTPALVLREVKVGEADRILLLLTPEQGLISASAKGSLRLKSRLFSGCGLFCYSEFTLYEGRTMYRVDEAQVKNTFFGLRESVEGMALAMYLAELTAALAPTGKEAQVLLRLLLNSLYLLSENKRPLGQIKAVFELRAISEAGYLPQLLCCRECGKYEGGPFYLDPEEGSLLCGDCAAKAGRTPNLDPASLTALRHIALVEDKRVFNFSLAGASMRKLGRVTERYALCLLDKPLNSLDFLRSVWPEEAAKASPVPGAEAEKTTQV